MCRCVIPAIPRPNVTAPISSEFIGHSEVEFARQEASTDGLPVNRTFPSILLSNTLSVVHGHQCSGHGSDEPFHVIPV